MPLLGPGYQYVTVFPLIVVVAILAGRGPAILHAVIGGILTTYLFSTELNFTAFSGTLIVILTGFLAGSLTQRLHDSVTQNQQRIEALAKSEQRFRGTFENAAVGITHLDLNGNWLEVNQKFCEMVGYTRDAMIGTEFTILTHPDDMQADRQRFKDLIAGKAGSYFLEKRYMRKDGSLIWVELYRTLQRNEAGVPIYSISIVIDITKRKKAQEELLAFKNKLEEKNKELESVIGIVSHDLRSPLVNVKGFASEIKRDCVLAVSTLKNETSCEKALSRLAPVFEESIPESVKFIDSSAQSMNNLVDSLVQVTRAGLAAIKPEQLDMNEIMRNVFSSIEFKLKQSNVSYDKDYNLPPCYGDKTQITQIFTNLLDNAVKYLDPDRPGKISVSGRIQGQNSLYWVADNGIGIAPQDQKKIFDIYQQLHEKAAGGLGMGLNTVKRMVDRNNGKIWLNSEKGKGSTFYILLPSTQ